MQTITPLNEKQLRASLRHPSTKPFAFCNLATKSDGAGPFEFGTVQEVIVYGKGQSRTVAVRTSIGRRKTFETLGKVSADANGYALAAELIEHWLQA